MLGELVLVPGHGVCLQPAAAQRDEAWVGIYPGEAACLVEHARAGVELAAERGASLVFSGGQTRREAGPRSEAQSYLELASANSWWGHPEVAERCLVEGFARDSLENLAFALDHFHSERGAPPAGLWICGWSFKAERFELHRVALGWTGPYRYVGVNDPQEGEPLEAARRGELAKRQALLSDPFLAGAPWQALRQARDPFQQSEPYRARLDLPNN